ncbi:MAG: GvpL/GvpF family gas vesicle protein, partial [Bacteroidota bacterium]
MSKTPEFPEEGKYIYGIIRHTGPIEFGPIGIGKRADLVYGINYKGITAIVSNSPVMIYEARRVNLIAHEKVLEEMMKQYTVLPVRFSTISEH